MYSTSTRGHLGATRGTRHRYARFALLVAAGFFTLAGSARAQCVGDCGGNGEVTVDEIIIGVNIALGLATLDTCPVFDSDGNGEVTVTELIQAVNNALNGCPASPTETPTLPTETPGDTPTPTPTVDLSLCGNGVVDFDVGETCDDGNTVEGDACPANCRIAACTGSTDTLDVDVSFTPPAGVDLAGLTVFVRYPEAVVRIPGRASEQLVQDRVSNLPDNTFTTPNDLDYAFRLVILTPDSSAIPAGRLFTVRFDRCEGTATPVASDFTCIVEDAADTNNEPVSGTTCAVALP